MHHLRLFWALCGLSPFLAILAGCDRGEPLSQPAAMLLLRDGNTGTILLRFNASPPDRASSPVIAKAYDDLVENHILDCSDPSKGNLCVPGPAGGPIKQDTATSLSLPAGHWAPSTLISLQRTGATTATAQVRMTFEPSNLYRGFETAFDALRISGSSRELEQKSEGKIMTATYRQYDDGWHLESLE
jgi:hypothetical protein